MKYYNDQHADDRSNPEITMLLVLGAAVLTFVLGFVPLAGFITYPLRLFTTLIHETSHALAALVTFGDVHGMVVRANGSGTTYVSGGSTFLVGSAGYLGTTLFGVLTLLSTRKTDWSRWLLGLTGAVILLVTTFYAGEGATWPAFIGAGVAVTATAFAIVPQKLAGGLRWALIALATLSLLGSAVWLAIVGGLLTFVLGLSSAALLLAVARFTGGDVSKFIAAFLGVNVALDALGDTVTLLKISTQCFPCAHTDATIIAKHFGGHAAMWAGLWTLISIILVAGAALFVVWEARRFMKKSAEASRV